MFTYRLDFTRKFEMVRDVNGFMFIPTPVHIQNEIEFLLAEISKIVGLKNDGK